MELPRRPHGDELLQPGELTRVRDHLRKMSRQHDLATVIGCAFDHRTRMLPFLYADLHMAPAGARAIGSAMVDAGFPKTRIVLQQWNPGFRPSRMAVDGQMPDLFMVSSMSLHAAQGEALIRDACRIDAEQRPLIITGGPWVIYEPWTAFSAAPDQPWAADVAVTGEEYVLLQLLEVLLSVRARHEPLRSAFERARSSGALDQVAGLVYALPGSNGVPEQLVDTGIQRLLGDLDELPSPVLGYQILEPPSRSATLGSEPIPASQVRRFSRIASLVLTQGCQFSCPYCPIPAYNQRQHRGKSGERIADEIEQLYQAYGLRVVFGADDNFLAQPQRALAIAEQLVRRVNAGSRAHCKVRWGTEATIHDSLKLREHLPLLRSAGLWALWLGVEDMSGALVKKGQTADRTLEAFAVLRDCGIFPNPMLMHHDSQPLLTVRGGRGLLNQVGRLRRAGAISVQVLSLIPSPGSKSYDPTYTSGMAFASVNGRTVEPRLRSGMHVIASNHPRPWVKQLSVLAAYAFFYHPLRLVWSLAFSKSRIARSNAATWPPPDESGRRSSDTLGRRFSRAAKAHLADAGMQLFGAWALAKTLPSTLTWAWHLMRGRIARCSAPPGSAIPMRSPLGETASHAPAASSPPELASPESEAGATAGAMPRQARYRTAAPGDEHRQPGGSDLGQPLEAAPSERD